ncbi:MAG TPA: hypothetical protein VEJ63_03430 [Planctomycetota bacterium]|nr:hypothetical protein [Planctomycetota bacterium]
MGPHLAVRLNDIVALRDEIVERRRRLTLKPEYFLVVTPLGLPHAFELQTCLDELKIGVSSRLRLPDWPRISSLLYVDTLDDRHLVKALAFEILWRKQFTEHDAEYWGLASAADYARLVALKRVIRPRFPKIKTQVTVLGELKLSSLHAFHVPDPERVLSDAAILAELLRADQAGLGLHPPL